MRWNQGIRDMSAGTGGTYIERKRQQTIYASENNNIKSGITNSYNKNQYSTYSDSGVFKFAKIRSTPSYSTLLDLSKGGYIYNNNTKCDFSNEQITDLVAKQQHHNLSQINSVDYLNLRTNTLSQPVNLPIQGIATTTNFKLVITGNDALNLNNGAKIPLQTTVTSTSDISGGYNTHAYPGYVVDPTKEIVTLKECENSNSKMKKLVNTIITKDNIKNHSEYLKIAKAEPLNGIGKSNWRTSFGVKPC